MNRIAGGILGVVATVLVAGSAFAQSTNGSLTLTPVIEPASNRYILMVLDQSDFDLTKSGSKVNVLLDTQTGRTWALQFGTKPNSNERGYVWSEIPFAPPPK